MGEGVEHNQKLRFIPSWSTLKYGSSLNFFVLHLLSQSVFFVFFFCLSIFLFAYMFVCLFFPFCRLYFAPSLVNLYHCGFCSLLKKSLGKPYLKFFTFCCGCICEEKNYKMSLFCINQFLSRHLCPINIEP